jgi:hypothetical protein
MQNDTTTLTAFANEMGALVGLPPLVPDDFSARATAPPPGGAFLPPMEEDGGAPVRLTIGNYNASGAPALAALVKDGANQKRLMGEPKSLLTYLQALTPGQQWVLTLDYLWPAGRHPVKLALVLTPSTAPLWLGTPMDPHTFYVGSLYFPKAYANSPNFDGRWVRALPREGSLYETSDVFKKSGEHYNVRFIGIAGQGKYTVDKPVNVFVPEDTTPKHSIAKRHSKKDGAEQIVETVVAEMKPEGSLEGVFDWILPRLPPTSQLASEGFMSRDGILLGYSRFPVINEDGSPKGFCSLFLSSQPIRVSGLPYYRGVIAPEYVRVATTRGDLHITGNATGEALLNQVGLALGHYNPKARFLTFCPSGDWEIAGPSCGLALAVVASGNFTHFLCTGELELDPFGNLSLLPVAGVDSKLKVAQHYKSPILMKSYLELREALFANGIEYTNSVELLRGSLMKPVGNVFLADDLGSALASTLHRDSQAGFLARQEAPRIKKTPAPAKKKAPMKPLEGVVAEFVAFPPVEQALSAMTADARSLLLQDLLALEGQEGRMRKYMESAEQIQLKFKVAPAAFLRALRKGSSEKMDSWLQGLQPKGKKKQGKKKEQTQVIQI